MGRIENITEETITVKLGTREETASFDDIDIYRAEEIKGRFQKGYLILSDDSEMSVWRSNYAVFQNPEQFEKNHVVWIPISRMDDEVRAQIAEHVMKPPRANETLVNFD
jgi:hypothetical protein